MGWPMIAVSAETVQMPGRLGGLQTMTLCGQIMTRRVEAMGCMPVIVPNIPVQANDLAHLLDAMDGLLLTSGVDLDPASYQAEQKVAYLPDITGFGEPYRRPKLLAPNPLRDAMELALYHGACARGIPVFGVCRGMQLINIAEGGTLHQEVAQHPIRHALEDDGWIPHHPIAIAPDSLCGHLLRADSLTISSIHHQAIDRLGKGLRVSAQASDGVIEMIERQGTPQFVVGVQGHIEKGLGNQPELDGLWRGFAQAAKRYHQQRIPAC